MQVLIKMLGPSEKLIPSRQSEHAAGLDLFAAIEKSLRIPARERAVVPCGFAMALPPGFEAQVRPRSGLAAKHGVTVLNSPGTIDADYRGEVCVILQNHGSLEYTVEPGDRIAQMVIAPLITSVTELRIMNPGEDLPPTVRGTGGMGSTGR